MTAVSFRVPGQAVKQRFPVLRRLATAVLAVAEPHKASVRRLADMPLAVLGTGCIDFAAFHWHVLGWLVTGASLWVIEHLIADDDDSRIA